MSSTAPTCSTNFWKSSFGHGSVAADEIESSDDFRETWVSAFVSSIMPSSTSTLDDSSCSAAG